MKMDMEVFRQKHRALYLADPAGYAPFAFWKMQALCADAEAFHLPEHGCYYVIRDGHLLIYASPGGRCRIPTDELNRLSAISLPADLFDELEDRLTGFEVSYSECLFYDFSYRSNARDQSAFGIVEFDFADGNHYRAAAEIINQDDDWLNPANIKKMTGFPSFDPRLWFFIEDGATKELIGFCISTYDPSVRETDLDWIFIRPQHHGRGAGRFMIEEIIRRSRDRSDVIRVGGTVEFYKRCGFYNKRLWVWAAKPGYRFVAPAIQP